MMVVMIVSFPFIIFTIKSYSLYTPHSHTHTHNKTSAYYETVPAPSPLNILNIAVLIEQKKKTSLVSNFQ